MKNNNNVSATVLTLGLRISDIALIAFAGVIAYYIRYPNQEPQIHDWSVLFLVPLASANIFHLLGLYDPHKLIADPYQMRKLVFACLSVGLITLAIGYGTKTSSLYSRTWMAMWAGGAFAFLCLVRVYISFRLTRWQKEGRLTRRVAIIGAGPQGQSLIEHQSVNADHTVSIMGVFDDRRSRIPMTCGGVPVRGTVDDLLGSINKELIEEVIVALPWSAEARLHQIMTKLRAAPIDIRLCPEGVAYGFSTHSYSSVWGIGMLNAYDRPLKNWRSVMKNLEDRVLASLFLVFSMPLMLSVAIAIRLDSRGPILFKQRRYGFSNELIEVYKFRSLRHDHTDWDGERQVQSRDPRVTRVGRFLRRSHLDELPQLFNVLQGEMSIVGPRPHPTLTKTEGELFEDVVRDYFSRHRVKPGMTGWAQVNGLKGEADTKEHIRRRIEHDLYYIDRWSIWLDLKIIFLTPRAIFTSVGRA